MEVGGQRHAPAALPSEVSPGVHCTGGCVVHRAGLDGRGGKKISTPTGARTPTLLL